MSAKRTNDSETSDSQSLAKALGLTLPKTQSGKGPVYCGDLDMRIDVNGTWFYLGTPIGRKPLVKLFASVLKRDEKGDFWLITPAEMARIQVEDAPFLAVELRIDNPGPDQIVNFRTNLDDWIEAGPDHPIEVTEESETGEPRPYLTVRDNLKARLARTVYYHLVELGQEEAINGQREFGVRSNGEFYRLGTL